jgi:DNA topoisomerase-3
LLPPLRNGETAQLHDPKIENKETRHRRVTTKAL